MSNPETPMIDFRCKSCQTEPTDRINVMRFISHLDSLFAKNDTAAAVEAVEYWEKEARRLHDSSGLLSVLNEQLGLFRNIGDFERAQRAVDAAAEILNAEKEPLSLSKATVAINLATTLKALGKSAEAIPFYERAQRVYSENSKTNSFEFAALLNNKSAALADLGDISGAEAALIGAIEILKAIGGRDAEIALSYANLAQLSPEKAGPLLRLAWDCINSPSQPHDSNFAFVISKCASVYEHFGMELEAEALRLTAKEIYGQ